MIAEHLSKTKRVQLRVSCSSSEIITERKKAEEALKESEAFNASLLNDAPNPIMVTGPDSSIRYVNGALEKLTGYNSGEIIGLKVPYPWWPQDTIAKFEAENWGGRGKETVLQEMHFKKKNEDSFWVILSLHPIKKDGELNYNLVNWVDITERRQAEETLRESEKKFSTVFQAGPAIIAITALKKMVIY